MTVKDRPKLCPKKGAKARWPLAFTEHRKCGGKYGCGKVLPRTSEFFYVRADGKFLSPCKECCKKKTRDYWVNFRKKDEDERGQYRGESHHWSKLTEEHVKGIIEKSPFRTTRALASEYGVHPDTVTAILKGKSWRHL